MTALSDPFIAVSDRYKWTKKRSLKLMIYHVPCVQYFFSIFLKYFERVDKLPLIFPHYYNIIAFSRVINNGGALRRF